jgi:hypothetical protein
MLSEALQRNAEHEARLSNISGPFSLCIDPECDLSFFASLRMAYETASTLVWSSV